MRTKVSPEEVDRYQRDGFVLMRDFLSADELQDWRETVERGIEVRLERNDELSNAGTDDYYEKVFTQVSGLIRVDERMAELLLDPQLGDVAAELTGVEQMRLWNDQALVKPPWGNPTAWHLDAPWWSFDDRRALTIWVALDDATVENGCLWYLPGTHRSARFDAFGSAPTSAGSSTCTPSGGPSTVFQPSCRRVARSGTTGWSRTGPGRT